MKQIAHIRMVENQDKGEMSAFVFRGHASVQFMMQCDAEPEQQIDVYLKPEDAIRIADALRKAAAEVDKPA